MSLKPIKRLKLPKKTLINYRFSGKNKANFWMKLGKQSSYSYRQKRKVESLNKSKMQRLELSKSKSWQSGGNSVHQPRLLSKLRSKPKLISELISCKNVTCIW